MPLRSLLLGLSVTVIWGFNFSFIKVAEDGFHPFLLATLRFVLTVIPAIFFFPRPKVPFKLVLAYGFVFGALQFGLLFAGIAAGLSAGLSSVVLQLQVFFTILLGVLLMKEHIKPWQIAGVVLGFSGVAVTGLVQDGSVTIAGLLLVAGAGLSWGLANVIVKKAKPADPVGFMVWASTVPVVPLAIVTVLVEGTDSVRTSFSHLSWGIAGAVLYLVYPTTLFGYSVWNGLLRRYPTSLVAPLTLLVPFFGMAGSMLIFGEELTVLKVLAACLMILGLCVNQFAGRFGAKPAPAAAPATEPAISVATLSDSAEHTGDGR
ncbi:EamA family transporter [Dactylosporangium sp. NPDC051484]|uniref:EamA family transporter n=1 Tax=Dactylosporangium sp. NPDC051484 TaxID=3154942 RepID=UPI00344EADE1